jgi:hypothetical protein
LPYAHGLIHGESKPLSKDEIDVERETRNRRRKRTEERERTERRGRRETRSHDGRKFNHAHRRTAWGVQRG